NPKEKCNKGDLFISINPEFFIGKEEFKKKVDKVLEEIKKDNALIPGEIEENNKKKRLVEGIEIDDNLYKQLKEICEKLGLDLDSYF
ncbi:Ldh family oxidoreductase, partial [Methanocaldococcus sp.]